jgi:hypothetical protein
MRKTLRCAVLATAILGASGLACSSKSSSVDTSGVDGYPVVCKQCGHNFVIPLDKLTSYPAGPNGEGFKCEKCGQFAAMRATKCVKCNKWYVAEGRGMPCPYCSKAGATQNPS